LLDLLIVYFAAVDNLWHHFNEPPDATYNKRFFGGQATVMEHRVDLAHVFLELTFFSEHRRQKQHHQLDSFLLAESCAAQCKPPPVPSEKLMEKRFPLRL
jgi:hypothetical protein